MKLYLVNFRNYLYACFSIHKAMDIFKDVPENHNCKWSEPDAEGAIYFAPEDGYNGYGWIQEIDIVGDKADTLYLTYKGYKYDKAYSNVNDIPEGITYTKACVSFEGFTEYEIPLLFKIMS